MSTFPLTPLSAIATVRSGFAFKSDDWRASGVPVVKIANVKPGWVDLSGCSFVDELVASSAREFVLVRDDIVVAMTGYVGEVARVRSDERMLLNQRVGKFSVTEPAVLDHDYLYHFLRMPATKEEFAAKAHGSAQANISPSLLLSISLPLPAIHEQRAIAEVLGALEDKIAANAKLVDFADRLCAALTRNALDSLASKSLSSIAVVTMGTSPAGTSFNEEGHGSVFYQGVRDFGVRFPRRRVWTTRPVRFAEATDSLLSVRAPVGHVNLASESTCIGRGLASVRSRDGRPNTLFHLLRDAPEIWAPYEAEGTIFGSINKTQLESIEVPTILAARADQLEAQLAGIEARIASALSENEMLATTRDALLPQLMSGKLRVKDAEKVLEGVL